MYINTDSAVLHIYEQQTLEQLLIHQAIRNHNAEIISNEDLEILKEAILLFDQKPYLMNNFDKNTEHAVENLVSAQFISNRDIQTVSEIQIYKEKLLLLDQKIHEMQVMNKNEQEAMKYNFHDGCTQAVMINCTINDLL